MQEGTVAFLQMVKIVQALVQHRHAGLPYLVYLRHPTTGGVFASWGSLGQLTGAQPGALIGFLGPRVYEALYGDKFPEGVQVAENLYRLGLVDAVLSPEDLGEIAARALDVMCTTARVGSSRGGTARGAGRRRPGVGVDRAHPPAGSTRRRGAPPGGLAFGHDHERHPRGRAQWWLILAMAKFGAAPCVVVGQDRLFRERVARSAPAAFVRRDGG